LNLC